jgi:hypothetical protein
MRRSKRRTMGPMAIAAVCVVAALVAGATAESARADSPSALSIEFTVTEFTPTSFSGNWQGSGAIDDAGPFRRTEVNFTGSLPNSPTVVAFESVLVLTSSLGTITLKEELRFTLTDVIGVWQIVKGAGSYEQLRGHGSFEFISSLHFVDSGVISGRG